MDTFFDAWAGRPRETLWRLFQNLGFRAGGPGDSCKGWAGFATYEPSGQQQSKFTRADGTMGGFSGGGSSSRRSGLNGYRVVWFVSQTDRTRMPKPSEHRKPPKTEETSRKQAPQIGGGLKVGVAQTVFLVNRVFVPCQKGAVLTKTAKMTNLHSTH